MHQSTTLSLSQTIWPRWASRQFLTLPIVQTLLPVIFAYSLSSEAVVIRELRRWKSVVFWPSNQPNMPFQRRGSWLTIWDKVKSHSTVRLMHRKRVTCELHDSYFHSMTIKHAIPSTAEVTYPDGQLWGDIEWAIELLYNSVILEVS